MKPASTPLPELHSRIHGWRKAGPKYDIVHAKDVVEYLAHVAATVRLAAEVAALYGPDGSSSVEGLPPLDGKAPLLLALDAWRPAVVEG